MPFFSIIIPTYNRAHLLSLALESVLNQTFNDWECIVVDDGSTDSTRSLIDKWIKNDSRFKYIYQKNAERSAARNNGISHSNGEWICFMDSDSVFSENRLFSINKFILNSITVPAMIYTDICYRSDDDLTSYIHKGTIINNSNLLNELVLSIIATPQTCIHSSILKKNYFNEKFFVGEDMELWLRIAINFPLVYLSGEASVIERLHSGRSVSRYGYNVIEDMKTWDYIFEYHKKNSKIGWYTKRKKKSSLYLDASIFYLLNNKRITGIKYLLKSIVYYPFSIGFKYKINILASAIFCPQRVIKITL